MPQSDYDSETANQLVTKSWRIVEDNSGNLQIYLNGNLWGEMNLNASQPQLVMYKQGSSNTGYAQLYVLGSGTGNGSDFHIHNANGVIQLDSVVTANTVFNFGQGVTFRILTITANTTLNNAYGFTEVNATSGAITVTLPLTTSAYTKGLYLMLQKIDSSANAVTIVIQGSDTIDGATSISLSSQYSKAVLISNGNGTWHRLI